MFGQRLAHSHALRHEEGVGHAAADHQMIDLGHEVAKQFQLRRDLRPAHDRRHRALRIAKRGVQRLQLCLHQPPGAGGHQMRHPFGGGMGAVGGRKGVVHIGIAKRGQPRREDRIVLFLALVKARVLQQQHIARTHRRDSLLRRRAHAILGERDLLAQGRLKRGQGDLQAHLRDDLALGAAEMGQQDRAPAFLLDVLDGGDDLFDSRRIGHPPGLYRHVDIDADKDDLLRKVHVVERFPVHRGILSDRRPRAAFPAKSPEAWAKVNSSPRFALPLPRAPD